MTYFPQIGPGIITQRPYSTSTAFNNIVAGSPAGRPYGFQRRGSGLAFYPIGPLKKFNVGFTAITDAEKEALRTFFLSMKGRVGEFVFLDPSGNLIPNSEVFSDGSWTLAGGSIAATAQADPFGGTRATRFTSAGTMSLKATIIPVASVSGFWFCNSIYAKAAAGGMTITVDFIDTSTSGTLGTTAYNVFTLAAGQWTRVFASAQIGVAHPLAAKFTVSGSGTVTLFGPQSVPTGGPGEYTVSPMNLGYRSQCRFDTDIFAPNAVGPNQWSLQLPIVEVNS